MPTLTSPYPGNETNIKEVGQIIEEFLEANWTLATPNSVSDIVWGATPKVMFKEQKEIAIRCYHVFSNIGDMDISGFINEYKEFWRLDVYARDPLTIKYRSDRLLAIMRHIEQILLTNKTTLQSKGLSTVSLRSSSPIDDPDHEDLYHASMAVDVIYVKNVV